MKSFLPFLPVLGLALLGGAEMAYCQPAPGTMAMPSLTAPAVSHFPGEEMIDVAGRRLQVLRGGQGSPTIVFESGLSRTLADWSKVLPEVNKLASTFCYTRAGLPPSDPAPPGPRTALVIAEDLHTLLSRAGIKPPYVLVGHSYGGASMRIYAIKYPAEVAGLVLVDPQNEGMLVRARAIDPKMASSQLPVLSEADRARLPSGMVQEMEGSDAMWSSGDLGIAGKLPPVPVVLITALKTGLRGGPEADPDLRLKRQLHDELFQGVDYGMHVVTDRSPHNVMGSEPGLVVSAIRFVLDAANHAPRGRPKPVAIRLSADQLAPLLGEYVDSKGQHVSVVATDGHVFFQALGTPRTEIMPESETSFFTPENLDARFVFEKDAAGKIASFSLVFGRTKAATFFGPRR